MYYILLISLDKTNDYILISFILFLLIFSSIIAISYIILSPPEVAARGRMMEPAQRSSMWTRGFNSPRNDDDTGLNCGGSWVSQGCHDLNRCESRIWSWEVHGIERQWRFFTFYLRKCLGFIDRDMVLYNL